MKTKLSLLLACLLSACGGTGPPEDARPVPAARPLSGVTQPWTQRFLSSAILVADFVVIEGPQDLLDHVAIRQEPELFTYRTETTTDGLLQEVVRRPNRGGTEIRAQLDAWSIGAIQRLVVLQRPGEVPVTVRARGNAVWIDVEEGDEKREPELEFRGERP